MWQENRLLFNEDPTSRALSFAKKNLSNLPNFLNPKDTLLSHSIRVASKIHELIDDPSRRNIMTAASLLLEIPQAKGLKVNEVFKEKDYNIWFPIWCYNLDKKKYPDCSNIRDVIESRIKHAKVISTPEQLQSDILFIFLVNELDFLNSQLDFYNDLVQIFGDNEKEIFLGSLPYSFRDHVWVHERLIQEVTNFEQLNNSQWKKLLTEYRSQLEFFKSIAPDLLEEPENADILKDSVALRSQSRLIVENDLTLRADKDLLVSVGGDLALEKGVKFDGSNKISGDIDINLYSFKKPSVDIDENEQKLLANKWLVKIFEYCHKNGIVWKGSLRLNSFAGGEKNLLQELKVVTLEDFVNEFDFQLEDQTSAFERFVFFTMAIGDSVNALIMTPQKLESVEKVSPLTIAQSIIIGETYKNPAFNLLIDSHLYLPYVFPDIVRLLEQTKLYSKEGLESLVLAALDNKRAWVNLKLKQYIYKNTPFGIFSSQDESIEFLQYLADSFRESFGKSTATGQLLSNDYAGKFIRLYEADKSLQTEVLNSLEKWYMYHPHLVEDDNKEKERMERLNYYDKLILEALKQ